MASGPLKWLFVVGLGAAGVGAPDADAGVDPASSEKSAIHAREARGSARLEALAGGLIEAFNRSPEDAARFVETHPADFGDVSASRMTGDYLADVRRRIGPLDVHTAWALTDRLLLLIARQEGSEAWHQVALCADADGTTTLRIDPMRW